MSANIEGFGLSATLVASVTFPNGIPISQFADDTDPFDIPEITIADSGMGLNGDLLKWSVATPISVNLAVIPTQEDDINLGILLENNRVGRGKIGSNDSITLTGIYPDGSSVVFTNGFIVTGTPGNGIATSGRIKTKTYNFTFENRVITAA